MVNYTSICQYFSDILPIRHVYTIRRVSFLTSIETSKNSLLCLVQAVTNENHNVIGKLADRYNCNVVRFTEKFNLAVRNQFKLDSLDYLYCDGFIICHICHYNGIRHYLLVLLLAFGNTKPITHLFIYLLNVYTCMFIKCVCYSID